MPRLDDELTAQVRSWQAKGKPRPRYAPPAASQKQMDYIRDLMRERVLTPEQRAKAEEQMAIGLDLPRASRWIDRLRDLPRASSVSTGMPRPRGGIAQTPTLPGPDVVPAGRYAVDSVGGELRFYRVARGTRNPNRVWIHVQHGPDESEVPYSVVGYATILGSIADAGPRECALRYGHEIKRCSTCGIRLTNRLSRELGIGPVCGGRFWDEDEWKGVKGEARAAIRARGENPDENVEG